MALIPVLREMAVNFTIISILAWLVARRRANLDVGKLVCVVAGWWVGGLLISLYVTPQVGWLSVLLTHAVLAALLIFLCATSLLQAVIVVAAFAVIKVGMETGWGSIMNAELPQVKAQFAPEKITQAEGKRSE